MRFQMTRTAALAKQAEQLEWYTRNTSEANKARAYALVADSTHADKLDGDGPHDVVEINRHIPRGASIEYMLFGKDFGGC